MTRHADRAVTRTDPAPCPILVAKAAVLRSEFLVQRPRNPVGAPPTALQARQSTRK
jgi:hypothetical protein